jgi:hypothetical protein
LVVNGFPHRGERGVGIHFQTRLLAAGLHGRRRRGRHGGSLGCYHHPCHGDGP